MSHLEMVDSTLPYGFRLRVVEKLREKLKLESLKVGKSLNSNVVRVLQKEVENSGQK